MKTMFDTETGSWERPLLAYASRPVKMADEDEGKDKDDATKFGHTTAATYCSGPDGTVVDTPAGWDIP